MNSQMHANLRSRKVNLLMHSGWLFLLLLLRHFLHTLQITNTASGVWVIMNVASP